MASRLPPEEIVTDAEAAVAAAVRIGFPVVLKAVRRRCRIRADAGLVHLGLRDAAAVRAAAIVVTRRCAELGATLEGMLVAKQIAGGIEMVLGIHRDPEMGPVVMVGLGGIWLELFKDVAFAPPELGEMRARETIAATRAATILAGYRGAPMRDVSALARAMVRLGGCAGSRRCDRIRGHQSAAGHGGRRGRVGAGRSRRFATTAGLREFHRAAGATTHRAVERLPHEGGSDEQRPRFCRSHCWERQWRRRCGQAQDAGPFYKGKTVTIVVGTSAGGGYDAYARLFGRYLGKHLPGEPTSSSTTCPAPAAI